MRIRIFVTIGRPAVHTGRIRRGHLCWDLIGWQSSAEIDVIGSFVLGWNKLLPIPSTDRIGVLVVP